jgi:hypothetical protein
VCVGGSPVTEAAAGEDWVQLDRTLETIDILASTRASDTGEGSEVDAATHVTNADEVNQWESRVEAFLRRHSVKAASLDPKAQRAAVPTLHYCSQRVVAARMSTSLSNCGACLNARPMRLLRWEQCVVYLTALKR